MSSFLLWHVRELRHAHILVRKADGKSRLVRHAQGEYNIKTDLGDMRDNNINWRLSVAQFHLITMKKKKARA
jgi:hypothetical protein